jgi:hypothetical protein
MNISAALWPWIAGWVFGALLAGHIAYGKGRSQALYIFIGLFLTPIVALLMIVFSRPDDAALQRRELHSGRAKICPACAEIVKREAKVCKHCGGAV